MPQKQDVILICHPYTARKDIGAGHDRYAHELLQVLRTKPVSHRMLDSGILTSAPKAAWSEALFPLRLSQHTAKVYHATASVPARSPVWLKKRPLITTIHDVIWYHVADQDKPWKAAYKKYCIKLAAQKSDLLIVPAISTKDSLMERFNVAEDRIRLVPYGIDHSHFYFSEKPVNAVKKILFVGATNRAKGVDSLIKCFHTVVKAYPNVELHIGSKGWDTPFLKNLLQDSPARHKIKFIGFIPEDKLREAYRDADIFVFPSRYGFGLSTFEAMACGTPTISGSALDAPDYIGDAGLLVDPENLESLAQAMISLLQDKKLYTELQARGLAKVRPYSWTKMGEAVYDVYREFL